VSTPIVMEKDEVSSPCGVWLPSISASLGYIHIRTKWDRSVLVRFNDYLCITYLSALKMKHLASLDVGFPGPLIRLVTRWTRANLIEGHCQWCWHRCCRAKVMLSLTLHTTF
jgi:hypothetical protein